MNFNDAKHLTHGVIVKTENILWHKYFNTRKNDGLLYRYVPTVLWINNIAIVPSEKLILCVKFKFLFSRLELIYRLIVVGLGIILTKDTPVQYISCRFVVNNARGGFQ